MLDNLGQSSTNSGQLGLKLYQVRRIWDTVFPRSANVVHVLKSLARVRPICATLVKHSACTNLGRFGPLSLQRRNLFRAYSKASVRGCLLGTSWSRTQVGHTCCLVRCKARIHVFGCCAISWVAPALRLRRAHGGTFRCTCQLARGQGQAAAQTCRELLGAGHVCVQRCSEGQHSSYLLGIGLNSPTFGPHLVDVL